LAGPYFSFIFLNVRPITPPQFLFSLFLSVRTWRCEQEIIFGNSQATTKEKLEKELWLGHVIDALVKIFCQSHAVSKG